MSEPKESTGQRTETRRTALKVFGGLLGVGASSAVGLGVFTRRGSATVSDDDFTAQDVALESDDGTVTDIWLQPDLTYSWSGLNSPPTETEFVVEVTTPDGGVAELGRETDEEVSSGTSGSDAYTFADRLTLISDGPWRSSDFVPGPDDGTETFGPITVTVTAKLRNGDDDSPYVDSANAEFSVTVTDNAVQFGGDSGHGIEGQAQTGGSTAGEAPDGDESSGDTGGGENNGNENENNGNGDTGNGNNGNGSGNGNNGNGGDGDTGEDGDRGGGDEGTDQQDRPGGDDRDR